MEGGSEIASRNHVAKYLVLLKMHYPKPYMGYEDIDAIGVTYGPGLASSLWLVSAAKALAERLSIPVIGVNLMQDTFGFMGEYAPSMEGVCFQCSLLWFRVATAWF